MTIWLCEVGNLAASIRRLGKVTGVGARDALPYYLRPLGTAAALSAARMLLPDALPPLAAMTVFLALYVLFTLGMPEGKRRRLSEKAEPAA